jgi:hypothetical protein
MDGHANAPETTINDLASFLADTPETESEEQDEVEQNADDSTVENDTEEEADDQTEEDSEEEETEGEEPAPERKIKVTIKGEDGSEVVEEVPETELVKGYQRQADYTRKTQALAEREHQAVQTLQAKHQEIQSQYLHQAELTRAAVVQMAGIKTPDEMAYLAQTDPAGWVAENQRQKQIEAYLGTLDSQIQAERQQAQAAQEEQRAMERKQAFDNAWKNLSAAKIDRTALEGIFSSASKNYGFTPEELNNIYDHRAVLLMRDAAAYRELQSKKAEVTKKADAAPRLPSKQNVANPKDKALEQKFKTGRAKLGDLAAYLEIK